MDQIWVNIYIYQSKNQGQLWIALCIYVCKCVLIYVSVNRCIHEQVCENVRVVWNAMYVYLRLTSPFNFGAALSAPCGGKFEVRLCPSVSWISWSAVILEWFVSCSNWAWILLDLPSALQGQLVYWIQHRSLVCVLFSAASLSLCKILFSTSRDDLALVSKFPPKNGVTPKLPSEVAQCL